MATSAHPHPLDDLLALRHRLEVDARADLQSLAVRDRSIGRELANLRARPVAQLRAWLHRVDVDSHDRPDAARAVSVLAVVLALVGLIVGAGVSRALLHYDGTQPVNLLPALAVLVGLQLLLLLALVVVALPSRLLQAVPGGRALQAVLSLLSPGRWVGAVDRLLPPGWRVAWRRLRGDGGSAVTDGVRKWLMLFLSQVFAVAFNVAALAVIIFLVTTRDIAFGWSSTLNLEAESLHRGLGLLAAPWSLVTAAQPAMDLIEATRIYRHESWRPLADVAVFGAWWPVLWMSVLVYGLLPRVVLLVLARARLNRAVGEAMLETPGAERVLDRLNLELVETEAADDDRGAAMDQLGAPAATALRFDGRRARVIDWAASGINAAAARSFLECRLGLSAGVVDAAGGRRGLDEDRALLARLAAADSEIVALLVKAWEPPTHEFVDFICELRAAVGEGRIVVVVPMDRTADGTPAAARGNDAQVWRTRLERLDDAALLVDGGAE